MVKCGECGKELEEVSFRDLKTGSPICVECMEKLYHERSEALRKRANIQMLFFLIFLLILYIIWIFKIKGG